MAQTYSRQGILQEAINVALEEESSLASASHALCFYLEAKEKSCDCFISLLFRIFPSRILDPLIDMNIVLSSCSIFLPFDKTLELLLACAENDITNSDKDCCL